MINYQSEDSVKAIKSLDSLNEIVCVVDVVVNIEQAFTNKDDIMISQPQVGPIGWNKSKKRNTKNKKARAWGPHEKQRRRETVDTISKRKDRGSGDAMGHVSQSERPGIKKD